MSDLNNIGVVLIFGASTHYFSVDKDTVVEHAALLKQADRVVLGATDDPQKNLAAFKVATMCGFLNVSTLTSYIEVKSTDQPSWVAAVNAAADFCREHENAFSEFAVDRLVNVRRAVCVVVL